MWAFKPASGRLGTARCLDSLAAIATERLANVPSTPAVIHAHVAKGIASYAEENNQDLVVVATQGLSDVAGEWNTLWCLVGFYFVLAWMAHARSNGPGSPARSSSTSAISS